MTEKCQGTLKNGKACRFNASWTHPTGSYCKIHAPDGSVEMEKTLKSKRDTPADGTEPTVKSPTRPRGNVSMIALFNEAYDNIERRFHAGEIERSRHIAEFIQMPLNERHTIIRRAMDICRSTEDTTRIISSLNEAMNDFKHATDEERISPEFRLFHLESTSGTWDNEEKGDTFLFERGNIVFFKDVNIHIANCSSCYTNGIEFNEICEDESVVYMGPKGAAKTPMGALLPPEDSEWFIPLPSHYPLRQTHNEIRTREILESIEKGHENPAKYLALRSKILMCVCLPSPCHCEVYVNVVRALVNKK